MKKFFLLIFTRLLFFSFDENAFAEEEAQASISELDKDPLRFTYIVSVDANLNISAGSAAMSAEIVCVPSVDSCRISAYLQRYVNGAWVTLQNWSQNYGTYYGSWSNSYGVTSGYNYRLRVYFYAYDGDIRESTYLTSTQYY